MKFHYLNKRVRKIILHILKPFLNSINHVTFRVHEPKFTNEIIPMIQHLQPGDIILSKTKGSLTNLIIPGFLKHASIYWGKQKGIPYIIEAVSPYVRLNNIYTFLANQEEIIILRPKVSEIDRIKMAHLAYFYVGVPYDYQFLIDDNMANVYCSELAYHCVTNICPQLKFNIEGDKVFNVKIVTADDILQRSNIDYDVVYSSF